MCGRYFIEADDADMAPLIRELEQKKQAEGVKTAGEIFPGDSAAVVCRGRREDIGVFAMEWGFGMNGKRIINARLETAKDRPLFRESMENRRCLLPMSAYFEWERKGRQRIRYSIAPERDGLCCLAGLYRFEGGRPVFTVLTTQAAAEIAFIHERMPVILPYADRETWILGGELPPRMKMRSRRLGDEQLGMNL